jgi:hypothetical protein
MDKKTPEPVRNIIASAARSINHLIFVVPILPSWSPLIIPANEF